MSIFLQKTIRLTFVTASCQCNSEICCAELLEKANTRFIELLVPVIRPASKSTFKLVLLTVILCSFGTLGAASGGRADENDHSSSSFVVVAGSADEIG